MFARLALLKRSFLSPPHPLVCCTAGLFALIAFACYVSLNNKEDISGGRFLLLSFCTPLFISILFRQIRLFIWLVCGRLDFILDRCGLRALRETQVNATRSARDRLDLLPACAGTSITSTLDFHTYRYMYTVCGRFAFSQ